MKMAEHESFYNYIILIKPLDLSHMYSIIFLRFILYYFIFFAKQRDYILLYTKLIQILQ